MSEIAQKLQRYNQDVSSYRQQLEEVIIGAILIEKPTMTRVIEIIDSKNFTGINQFIFATLKYMHLNRIPIDLLTVVHQLSGSEVKPYQLVKMSNKVSSAANVQVHAAILLEISIGQQFIKMYIDNCSDKKVEAFGEDILQELFLEKKILSVVQDAVDWISHTLPDSDFASDLIEFNEHINKRFSTIKKAVA